MRKLPQEKWGSDLSLGVGHERTLVSEKTILLGLGAKKCATTWLYHNLMDYPVLFAGVLKEYHVWNALHVVGFWRLRVDVTEPIAP